jgi:predicted transcriptional regulator
LIAGMLEFQLEKETRLTITHEAYNKEKKILTLYFAEEKVANEAAEATAKLAAEVEINESIDPSTFLDEPDLEITSTSSAREVPIASGIDDGGQREQMPDLGNLEVVRKILMVSKNGALKVNLMHSTRITLTEAKEYVQNLVKAGLLEIKKVGETESIVYQTTTKGQDYLDAHERLSSMLQQDFPDTRIIRKAQG